MLDTKKKKKNHIHNKEIVHLYKYGCFILKMHTTDFDECFSNFS